MTPYGPLSRPDLATLLTQVQQDVSQNLNCHEVGEIVEFDPATQSASVQIKMLRNVVDLTRDPPSIITKPYPLLVNCPVFVNAGGTGYLSFPIKAGDPCLVLFNDRDLDIWWVTGNTQAPNSDRVHDFSDGLVLVGFRNKANAITGFNNTGAVLVYEGARLTLDATEARLEQLGGKLSIKAKVALNGDSMTLKQLLLDIVTAMTALNAKTGPSAATQIATVNSDITALMQ